MTAAPFTNVFLATISGNLEPHQPTKLSSVANVNTVFLEYMITAVGIATEKENTQFIFPPLYIVLTVLQSGRDKYTAQRIIANP
jgi:hypothetical protein